MQQPRAFVVEAEIALSEGLDPAAVGAAVTVELCGHREHDVDASVFETDGQTLAPDDLRSSGRAASGSPLRPGDAGADNSTAARLDIVQSRQI